MIFKKYAGIVSLVLVGLLAQPGLAQGADKIRVVTTTSTIASLAHEITGDLADIHHVASAKRDVHFVSPNPKDVLKVKKADVFIHGGLDLEAWREPLLIAAGNPAFLGDRKRSIDVSRGVQLLEIPESLSRSEGDIHIFGNPHYWLDPVNGKQMAKNIADGLALAYPEHAQLFQENFKTFSRRLDDKLSEWAKRLEPFRSTAVIQYHKSWPYFAERFSLVIAGEIEPKPGIPPTAKHLAELSRIIREKNVKLIITESFRDRAAPRKISKEAGIPVVTLVQSVDGSPDFGDYISMMNHNIRLIEEVLSSKGDKNG